MSVVLGYANFQILPYTKNPSLYFCIHKKELNYQNWNSCSLLFHKYNFGMEQHQFQDLPLLQVYPKKDILFSYEYKHEDLKKKNESHLKPFFEHNLGSF